MFFFNINRLFQCTSYVHIDSSEFCYPSNSRIYNFSFKTYREKCTRNQINRECNSANDVCTSRLIAAHRTINAYMWTDFLQVVAQSIHLSQEKIDIGLRYSGTGDDIPEEVGSSIVRLVANHQRASLHHAAFQNWTYLETQAVLSHSETSSNRISEISS